MLRKRCSFLKTFLAGTLIFTTTLVMSKSQNGYAMMIPAQNAGAAHADSQARASDLQTIQKALESKMVRQRLAEFKLSPDQINSRLNQLSDQQLHQTAMRIQAVNPGGDNGGVVWVLGVVALVLLVIYLIQRI